MFQQRREKPELQKLPGLFALVQRGSQQNGIGSHTRAAKDRPLHSSSHREAGRQKQIQDMMLQKLLTPLTYAALLNLAPGETLNGRKYKARAWRYVPCFNASQHHFRPYLFFPGSLQVKQFEDLNNLKIRGVPESVQPSQLPHYARDLFHAVTPTLSPSDLMINRIHRIPKLREEEEEVPHDVLLRMHYFQVKETVLFAFRKKSQLPEIAASVQVLPNLSVHNLQRCKYLI